MMDLDLRRPMNVEELVRDCTDKLQHESKYGDGFPLIEIVVGTELMLDIAQRLLDMELGCEV